MPDADQLFIREVDWIVLTPENFEEQIEKIKKTGRPVVFFALTDKGYEALGLNLSDLRAYIQQQKAIIAAYEGYYKETSEALDEANSEIEKAQSEVEEQQTNKEEKKGIFGFLN